ncbi:MAG: methionine gamma-lyase family protein [Oscillospiraceae bacterium]|nr:methionine gamma-lyase family protein [Oscillospiraceae bacterium]
MKISQKIRSLAAEAEKLAAERFARIDAVARANTEKVLDAFAEYRVSEGMFAGSTGYGYNDLGRDTLDGIYARVLGTPSALVRTGFVNGTHAICCAMFSAVGTGDTLLSLTGAPYDTLRSVVGTGRDSFGSFKTYGINYRQVELLPDGTPDYESIAREAADPGVKAVFIQRSGGYTGRGAFSAATVNKMIETAKSVSPSVAAIVDNCYGEFVETEEPKADIMAGSLIKNPGGGLAPMGGYVAGSVELVENASFRLTVPGTGGEVGASLGVNRSLFQGLFMAPHTVAQALKTAVFAAALAELMGYEAFPRHDAERHDIIQSLIFNSPEKLKRFCRGIQAGSPVDSYVTPEAWDMPGYEDKVIMAAGAFIQGSSIELSCDGPMKPPYRAYLQGGLSYEAGRLGIMTAAEMLGG